jgi:hypothetical protein
MFLQTAFYQQTPNQERSYWLNPAHLGQDRVFPLQKAAV